MILALDFEREDAAPVLGEDLVEFERGVHDPVGLMVKLNLLLVNLAAPIVDELLGAFSALDLAVSQGDVVGQKLVNL